MMTTQKSSVTILVAEDDPEDQLLIEKAIRKNRIDNAISFVRDGEEMLDYLYHRNQYSMEGSSPEPGLILMDLNMPKKGGREVLEEIKQDPRLKHIPVVVLTTSQQEEDIASTYDLGVNSFITKPALFQDLVEAVRVMGVYWLDIVKLPGGL